MLKFSKIFILLIIALLLFHKSIAIYYYSKKFSKWIEREFTYNTLNIDYSGKIEVTDLKIKNSSRYYYQNIFEANKVTLNLDIKSLLFSKLVLINKLVIDRPNFLLEINEEKKSLDEENPLITYNDNMGLADKINKKYPDKIWPEKKKDVNFLILKAEINEAEAIIKISSLSSAANIKLSKMIFNNFGNEKDYQHYKEVLRIILFDIVASATNFELKKLLKQIYNY